MTERTGTLSPGHTAGPPAPAVAPTVGPAGPADIGATKGSQDPDGGDGIDRAEDAGGLEYVGTRGLVPTPRQREHDPNAGPAPDHDDAGEAAPTPTRRERVRAYLASINPAGVEGPMMPLVVLSASAALGGWSSQALGLAAPEIQASFGASVTMLTLVSTITSTFMLIIGIPLGYLVDRVSRVWLVRISALLAPVGDAIQATTTNFGIYTLGNTFGEVARTPAAGADMPLMADYYRARSRTRVYGFIALAGTIGGLVATPIVGYLVEFHGWRSATMTLAAMSMVVALLTFWLREPKRGATDRLDLGLDELSAEQSTHEPPPPSMGEALRGAWSIRTLRLQAIAGFVGTFAAPLNILVALVLASKFAMSPMERSMLAMVTQILVIPAMLLSVGIADRLIERKPSTLVALQAGLSFLSSVMLIAQAFAPNLAVFVVLSLVPALLTTVFGPIGLSVMSLVVPARYRGVGMQIFTPFALVGTLLGPVLVQVASQVTLQQSFLFFAPFLLISGLIYLASAGSVTGDIQRARASAAAEEVSLRGDDGHRDHLLVCRDVEACIEGAVILRGIDLEVRDGEILGLVGTNGAGKSTLLTAVCGLNPPTNGAIFVDGVETTYRHAHEIARLGVGYLPGGRAVFGDLTVEENLRAALATGRAARTDLAEVLTHFPQLESRLRLRAADLSGGEQQMLALAQTFAQSPRLLLIDELSLGLAPGVVESLLAALRSMNAAGTTVVLVEQSLNIAVEVCDRLIYLDQGRVTFEGAPAELLAQPGLVRSLFMGGAVGGLPGRTRPRSPGSPTPAEPVLTCTDITLDYGGIRALAGVDLAVQPLEIVGVIGPNGAGKSTLFDALSGYERLSSGTITLDGRDVTGASPDARARLGLSRAFQNARLFGCMTVRETIAVAFEHRVDRSVLGAALWLPGTRARQRRLDADIDELLALMGLGRYEDVLLGELSTGTRRAVEIACHMAAEPKVLLLDEPSSGLAQAETEALGPTLQRIVRDIGCALVVIEHDLPLLGTVADRLVAMERGAVVATGTPGEVLADERVRAGYLTASDTVLHRSGASPRHHPTGEARP